jgi:hypothetical protein
MSSDQSSPNADESLATSAGRAMGTSRRGFIAGAASAPLALGLLPTAFGGQANAAAAGPRAYTVGHVFLEIGGKSGYLKSFEGGEAFGVVQQESGFPFASKTVSEPNYQDIQLQVGHEMPNFFWNWVGETFEGVVQSRSGQVVTTNPDFKTKDARSFTDAFLTSIRFPKLDASSKEACSVGVTLDPASTADTKPPATAPALGGKQKRWLCSNFKIEIDDLDTKRVNKIEPFSVSVGNPGGKPNVDFSNLKLSFSQVDAKSWNDWYREFLLEGNTKLERNGKITILEPNLQTPMFEIGLENLGIFRLSPEKQVAGDDSILRMIAELYVERMHFSRL